MNKQLKLKFYYDHVLSSVYSEGESPFHQQITKDVLTRFIDPENVPKDARILDLGCGPGYFLTEMRDRGYTNTLGISLSREDIEMCQRNGHATRVSDMNFLEERDESVDFLFCRHSIEHSPFPYITLLEYNRALKPNGLLYIEVPQPNCEINHEGNRNHYSVLDKKMWSNLLQRTGFEATWYEYEFPVEFSDDKVPNTATEKYYIFVCRRKMAVDIK